MAAAFGLLLAGAAGAGLTPGPEAATRGIQEALEHLNRGRYGLAEQKAADLATSVDRAAGRAWAIVAAARERRGEYADAMRAYRLLLASCQSADLRQHALRRIDACRWKTQPAPSETAPSRRLSQAEVAEFAQVSDQTFTESSEHFIVQARNPGLAKVLAAQAEGDLRRICRSVLAGQDYPHSVEIYVWPTAREYAANAQDAPEWSGGSYRIESRDGQQVRRIDLTQLDDRGRLATVMLDRVLPHEMCHLVVREFFGDCPCPVFLNEGLAMMAESEIDPQRTLLAGEAVIAGEAAPLEDLLTGRPQDAVDVHLFYAESFSFTFFLHRRLTPEQFREFLQQVKNGCATADALQRALCVPPEEDFPAQLDAAWQQDAVTEFQILRSLKVPTTAPAPADE